MGEKKNCSNTSSIKNPHKNMGEYNETDEGASCFKQKVKQPYRYQAYLSRGEIIRDKGALIKMCQFFKKT